MKFECPVNLPADDSSCVARANQGVSGLQKVPLGARGCQAQQHAVWHSRQLFADATEVFIEHAGALYRLRITQANKLILTK